MEKCYEYFDCNKIDCIIFQNKSDKPCWETEDTQCFFSLPIPIIDEVNSKEKCNYCLYKDTITNQLLADNDRPDAF